MQTVEQTVQRWNSNVFTMLNEFYDKSFQYIDVFQLVYSDLTTKIALQLSHHVVRRWFEIYNFRVYPTTF